MRVSAGDAGVCVRTRIVGRRGICSPSSANKGEAATPLPPSEGGMSMRHITNGDLLTNGVELVLVEEVHEDTMSVAVHNPDTGRWDAVPDGVDVGEMTTFRFVDEWTTDDVMGDTRRDNNQKEMA